MSEQGPFVRPSGARWVVFVMVEAQPCEWDLSQQGGPHTDAWFLEAVRQARLIIVARGLKARLDLLAKWTLYVRGLQSHPRPSKWEVDLTLSIFNSVILAISKIAIYVF